MIHIRHHTLYWYSDDMEIIIFVVYMIVVYYEWMNRDLQKRSVYKCRCDERLNTKVEESTRLSHTG